MPARPADDVEDAAPTRTGVVRAGAEDEVGVVQDRLLQAQRGDREDEGDQVEHAGPTGRPSSCSCGHGQFPPAGWLSVRGPGRDRTWGDARSAAGRRRAASAAGRAGRPGRRRSRGSMVVPSSSGVTLSPSNQAAHRGPRCPSIRISYCMQPIVRPDRGDRSSPHVVTQVVILGGRYRPSSSARRTAARRLLTPSFV